MNKILLCVITSLITTFIFSNISSAIPIKVSFSGTVGCSGLPGGCTDIDDPYGIINGSIAVGDSFEGFFILPETLPLNSPGEEYLINTSINFPFYLTINGEEWLSTDFLFQIQDDDPFNEFDHYAAGIQNTGNQYTSLGDSFTGGLQLFDRYRTLPVSTNPLFPPAPDTFGWINRLQVWGHIDGEDSAWYLITGTIDSLSASQCAPVPEPTTMLLFGTGLAGLVSSRLRRKKK